MARGGVSPGAASPARALPPGVTRAACPAPLALRWPHSSWQPRDAWSTGRKASREWNVLLPEREETHVLHEETSTGNGSSFTGKCPPLPAAGLRRLPNVADSVRAGLSALCRSACVLLRPPTPIALCPPVDSHDVASGVDGQWGPQSDGRAVLKGEGRHSSGQNLKRALAPVPRHTREAAPAFG